MLDTNLIRKNPNEVKRGVASKNIDPKVVDQFLKLDDLWRKIRGELDNSRSKQRDYESKRDLISAKRIKDEIEKQEGKLSKIEKERDEAILEISNIAYLDVPVGKDETHNKVLREVGSLPKFDFNPKNHIELGEKLGIIDIRHAAEATGSRFSYLKREAVLLEFGLLKLALDKLMPHGFIPVVPPVMIRPEVYKGMGRLTESQKEERYFLEKDDLYLVGSAEHTIGPIHMNEVFSEDELPRRYVGFSTCFRREAGSYGKDTKGILRVHQFDKVEMFSYVKPENSEEEHKFLLSMQEALLQSIEIPYRVMEICTGDMGFTDARQYDIESWLPGEGKYRETHSSSNTTDFQARGINVKFKRKGNPIRQAQGKEKAEFVHMLNATAFAIGRTIISILENNQDKDGNVRIPTVLQNYVGIDRISRK